LTDDLQPRLLTVLRAGTRLAYTERREILMPAELQEQQLQQTQQMEVDVVGPEDANRLFICTGRAQASVSASGLPGGVGSRKEVFTFFVGPQLTRQQFHRAVAQAAPIAATLGGQGGGSGNGTWSVQAFQADWDDESSRVQVFVEVTASAWGSWHVNLEGFDYQVTILAAMGGSTPP
jgi:hypothetical protein